MSCLTISPTLFSFLLASMPALTRSRKLNPCTLEDDRLLLDDDDGGGVGDDRGGSIALLVSRLGLHLLELQNQLQF